VGRVGGVCGVRTRSERGTLYDGRTRDVNGELFWDPNWRGENGVELLVTTVGPKRTGGENLRLHSFTSPIKSWAKLSSICVILKHVELS
jgi:hypothetical protein